MNRETNDTIKIENNVLLFGQTILQLSNISNLEVKPRPKQKIPGIAYLLLLAGIMMFVTRETTGMGFFLAVVGLVIIIYISSKNSSLGKYLIITMNSGNNFLFYCKSESFLYRASNEIASSLNGKGGSIINFKNCNINASQIGGNDNQMTNGR